MGIQSSTPLGTNSLPPPTHMSLSRFRRVVPEPTTGKRRMLSWASHHMHDDMNADQRFQPSLTGSHVSLRHGNQCKIYLFIFGQSVSNQAMHSLQHCDMPNLQDQQVNEHCMKTGHARHRHYIQSHACMLLCLIIIMPHTASLICKPCVQLLDLQPVQTAPKTSPSKQAPQKHKPQDQLHLRSLFSSTP